MATQLGIKQPQQPQHIQSGLPQRASEIEILNPDETIEIDGVEYLIREYGHVEFIKLLCIVEPLISDLTQRLRQDTKLPLFYEHFLTVFSAHYEQFVPVVLQATSMSQETFEALPLETQEYVLAIWLRVNGHFFIRRAMMRGHVLDLVQPQESPTLAKSTQP